MYILAIETSCDETAAAVARGRGERVDILSSVVFSQIDIHKKFGGVVPEVAAREHVPRIMPVIDEALRQAGIRRFGLDKTGRPQTGGIDALAVAIGPGLITSLLIGVEAARTMAAVMKLPVVAVNHIEGHIYANFIGADPKAEIINSKQSQNAKRNPRNSIGFPAVILTVSGGHTMLVLMEGHGRYVALGETLDDAAGEAFDKAAQMLALGYPGGPAIAAAAGKFKISGERVKLAGRKSSHAKILDPGSKIVLPRPMINDKSSNFSFSGLKTALLYALKKDKDWKKRIPEYAHEFQEAVTDVLVAKTIKAAQAYNIKTVMLSGGVSANSRLREKMAAAAAKELTGAVLVAPPLSYTTDNAAMIAAAAYFRARRREFTPWPELRADANAVLT